MTVGTPRTRAPGPRSSPVLLPRSLMPLLPLPPPVTPSCRNDAHARSRATTAGDLSPSRYSCGVPIPWGSRGSAAHRLRAGARRLLTPLDSLMNRPHPPSRPLPQEGGAHARPAGVTPWSCRCRGWGRLWARLHPLKILSSPVFSDSVDAGVRLRDPERNTRAPARPPSARPRRRASPPARAQRISAFPGTASRACDSVKRLANAVGWKLGNYILES